MKNKIIIGIIGVLLTTVCMISVNKKYIDKKIDDAPENEKSVNNLDNSKEIYGTIFQQNSWAYNVTKPEVISEESDVIAKIKVLDIDNSTYKYSPNANPTTPIKVETLSILKGDKNLKINQILKWGGIVTIDEYIKNRPITSIQKMGLDKLSAEEKETKYMKIESSGDYELQIGKIYVVALNIDNQGNLFITTNGYSVFETNDSNANLLNSNTPQTYKNVLTGNKLIISNNVEQ